MYGNNKCKPLGAPIKVSQDNVTATNLLSESGIQGGDVDLWMVQVTGKCYFRFDGTDATNTDFYLKADEVDRFAMDFASMTKLSAIRDTGTINIIIQQMQYTE